MEWEDKNIMNRCARSDPRDTNWRNYSKSLIVELKEKLAYRRARTLALLSEDGDLAAFNELDTESDGLEDTSTNLTNNPDQDVEDSLPQVQSLSETSSLTESDYKDLNSGHSISKPSSRASCNCAASEHCSESCCTVTSVSCDSISLAEDEELCGKNSRERDKAAHETANVDVKACQKQMTILHDHYAGDNDILTISRFPDKTDEEKEASLAHLLPFEDIASKGLDPKHFETKVLSHAKWDLLQTKTLVTQCSFAGERMRTKSETSLSAERGVSALTVSMHSFQTGILMESSRLLSQNHSVHLPSDEWTFSRFTLQYYKEPERIARSSCSETTPGSDDGTVDTSCSEQSNPMDEENVNILPDSPADEEREKQEKRTCLNTQETVIEINETGPPEIKEVSQVDEVSGIYKCKDDNNAGTRARKESGNCKTCIQQLEVGDNKENSDCCIRDVYGNVNDDTEQEEGEDFGKDVREEGGKEREEEMSVSGLQISSMRKDSSTIQGTEQDVVCHRVKVAATHKIAPDGSVNNVDQIQLCTLREITIDSPHIPLAISPPCDSDTPQVSVMDMKNILEDVLNILKDNSKFYDDVDKGLLATLETHFTSLGGVAPMHENISSNSGHSTNVRRTAKDEDTKSAGEASNSAYTQGRNLQACLDKARLARTLQMEVGHMRSRVQNLAAEKAYEKAVKEFESSMLDFFEELTGKDSTAETSHETDSSQVANSPVVEPRGSTEQKSQSFFQDLPRSGTFLVEEGNPQNLSKLPNLAQTSSSAIKHKYPNEKSINNESDNSDLDDTTYVCEGYDSGRTATISTSFTVPDGCENSAFESGYGDSNSVQQISVADCQNVCKLSDHSRRREFTGRHGQISDRKDFDSDSSDSLPETREPCPQKYTCSMLAQLLDYDSHEDEKSVQEYVETTNYSEVIVFHANDASGQSEKHAESGTESSKILDSFQYVRESNFLFENISSEDKSSINPLGKLPSETNEKGLGNVEMEYNYESDFDADTEIEDDNNDGQHDEEMSTFDRAPTIPLMDDETDITKQQKPGTANAFSVDDREFLDQISIQTVHMVQTGLQIPWESKDNVGSGRTSPGNYHTQTISQKANISNPRFNNDPHTSPIQKPRDDKASGFTSDSALQNTSDKSSPPTIPDNPGSLAKHDNVNNRSSRKWKVHSKSKSEVPHCEAFIPKIEWSSSDEDPVDDLHRDISPSDYLKQRQKEEVDEKLEQLNQFAKRKRKSKSPFRLRTVGTVDDVDPLCNIRVSAQVHDCVDKDCNKEVSHTGRSQSQEVTVNIRPDDGLLSRQECSFLNDVNSIVLDPLNSNMDQDIVTEVFLSASELLQARTDSEECELSHGTADASTDAQVNENNKTLQLNVRSESILPSHPAFSANNPEAEIHTESKEVSSSQENSVETYSSTSSTSGEYTLPVSGVRIYSKSESDLKPTNSKVHRDVLVDKRLGGSYFETCATTEGNNDENPSATDNVKVQPKPLYPMSTDTGGINRDGNRVFKVTQSQNTASAEQQVRHLEGEITSVTKSTYPDCFTSIHESQSSAVQYIHQYPSNPSPMNYDFTFDSTGSTTKSSMCNASSRFGLSSVFPSKIRNPCAPYTTDMFHMNAAPLISQSHSLSASPTHIKQKNTSERILMNPIIGKLEVLPPSNTNASPSTYFPNSCGGEPHIPSLSSQNSLGQGRQMTFSNNLAIDSVSQCVKFASVTTQTENICENPEFCFYSLEESWPSPSVPNILEENKLRAGRCASGEFGHIKYGPRNFPGPFGLKTERNNSQDWINQMDHPNHTTPTHKESHTKHSQEYHKMFCALSNKVRRLEKSLDVLHTNISSSGNLLQPDSDIDHVATSTTDHSNVQVDKDRSAPLDNTAPCQPTICYSSTCAFHTCSCSQSRGEDVGTRNNRKATLPYTLCPLVHSCLCICPLAHCSNMHGSAIIHESKSTQTETSLGPENPKPSPIHAVDICTQCNNDTSLDKGTDSQLQGLRESLTDVHESLTRMEQYGQTSRQSLHSMNERMSMMEADTALKLAAQKELLRNIQVTLAEDPRHLQNNAITETALSKMTQDLRTVLDDVTRTNQEAIQNQLTEISNQFTQGVQDKILPIQEGLSSVKKEIYDLAFCAEKIKLSVEGRKHTITGKGMDYDTMKMRIVELTSQRDAEKVFHKITRESLRALERDHDRLRQEYVRATSRHGRQGDRDIHGRVMYYLSDKDRNNQMSDSHYHERSKYDDKNQSSKRFHFREAATTSAGKYGDRHVSHLDSVQRKFSDNQETARGKEMADSSLLDLHGVNVTGQGTLIRNDRTYKQCKMTSATSDFESMCDTEMDISADNHCLRAAKCDRLETTPTENPQSWPEGNKNGETRLRQTSLSEPTSHLRSSPVIDDSSYDCLILSQTKNGMTTGVADKQVPQVMDKHGHASEIEECTKLTNQSDFTPAEQEKGTKDRELSLSCLAHDINPSGFVSHTDWDPQGTSSSSSSSVGLSDTNF